LNSGGLVKHRYWFVLGATTLALTLLGCATRPAYFPESGQQGKDMVWVPTPEDTVEAMLDLAGVTSDDGRTIVGDGWRATRSKGKLLRLT
jgi:hypothetical protein